MFIGGNGGYLFLDVFFGEDYMIVLVKDDDLLNGVIIIDLVLILKYILNF